MGLNIIILFLNIFLVHLFIIIMGGAPGNAKCKLRWCFVLVLVDGFMRLYYGRSKLNKLIRNNKILIYTDIDDSINNVTK